jgi:chorismate dehydratase
MRTKKTTTPKPVHTKQRRCRLAVPASICICPLIEGLDGQDGIEIARMPPSETLGRLVDGYVQAALLPSIDLQSGQDLIVLPASCMSSAGRTLSVRIFSRVKTDQIQTLWVDMEARSCVALAKVLWGVTYRRQLRIIPFEPALQDPPEDAEAALLVGDKVVARPPIGFDWQIDLGAMWFENTGLPFVFSVWATLEEWVCAHLYDRLRDTLAKSAANLEQIARDNAGVHGWPSDLAVEYLTKHLQYDFKDEQREGIDEFFDLCVDSRIIDQVHPVRYYIPGS